MTPGSLCIIDFCGNDRTPGHWCDWHPETRIVIFGGAWGVVGVPDMPAPLEPDQEACEAWVRLHKPDWLRDYWTIYLSEEEQHPLKP